MAIATQKTLWNGFMKVHIGELSTINNEKVSISIEPANPYWDHGLSRTVDLGVLLVEFAGDNASDLRLENTPEDLWELNTLLGSEKTREVALELKRYQARPFYIAIRHNMHQKLYFEIEHPDQAGSDGFNATTRKQGELGGIDQIARMHSADDMHAFITADLINGPTIGMPMDLMPSAEALSAAVIKGAAIAHSVIEAKSGFAALVRWGQEP